MRHKDKVTLARRMLRGWERMVGTPIFQSIGWWEREKAIKIKIKKKNELHRRNEKGHSD